MNHQTAKILLIVVGAIMTGFNMFGSLTPDNSSYESNGYDYPYKYNPESNLNYETY